MRDWVTRFKANGTSFVPPGAKTTIRGNSATSVNRAIDTLRRVMDLAIERGAIAINPVHVRAGERRLKMRAERKKLSLLSLPSAAQLQQLFNAMENNGARGGWGIEAADFCRFLYLSGCRLAEAGPSMTWARVGWDKHVLHVPGTKTDSADRDVPLFAELETLLRRVAERRKVAATYSPSGKPDTAPSDRIFRLGECQRTIDAACQAVGITRITHHDFRHLFATRCIESGVDIPTVAKWLGHSDGGELAMRTYGHLRQEHNAAMAARVNFGGAA